MSTTRLVDDAVSELHERAKSDVEEGRLPSCQLAIALDDEIVDVRTYGDVPAGEATRYVIFSATKAIVAATVLQLLSEGTLRLTDRVADHIDAFSTNGKDQVTVEQVLTYTSGFAKAPLGPPAWWSHDSRLEAMSKWRLTGDPGAYDYHITSAHWVLAELIEAVDGLDYRDAVRKRLAEPLGLEALRLGVPADEQGDIARPVLVGEPATAEEFAAVGLDGVDPGEATDENLAAFARDDLIELGVPGGGAVSDAADLARLYQALMNNPGRLWDPDVLEDATSNVRITDVDMIRGVPANRTVAFMVAGTDGMSGGRGMGHGAGSRTFGHDGVGGQLAFADPDTGLSFAYLTNGMERNVLSQQRRARGIASRANKCATPYS